MTAVPPTVTSPATGAAGEVHVVFQGDDACDVHTWRGSARLDLPRPDWRDANERLAALNRTPCADGVPIARVLRQDGFEPWWFAQNHCLRWLVIPLLRYGPLLGYLEGARRVTAANPPRDFQRLVPLLRRAGIDCVGGDAPGGWPWREWLGLAGKLAVTFLALLVGLFRPGRVLLYSTAALSPANRCDPRLADLYRELGTRGLPVLELVLSEKNYRFFAEQRIRRRLCLFWFQLEAVVLGALPRPGRPALAHEPADRVERVVYDELWDRAVRSWRRMRLAKLVLRVVRPDVVLAMDDPRGFWLVAAARALGIPTIGFQHGAAAAVLMSSCLRTLGLDGDARSPWPDRYFVFSPHFRREYLAVSNLLTPDQVVAAGPMKRVRWRDERPPAQAPIRVMFVGEHTLALDAVHAVLAALVGDPTLEVWYRPEPDGADAAVLAAVRREFPGVQTTRPVSFTEDVADFDVCVGATTTALIECYQVLVPSVVVEGLSPYPQDSVRFGPAARVATHTDEVRALVHEASRARVEELRRVRDDLWGPPGAGYVVVADAVEAARERPATPRDRR